MANIIICNPDQGAEVISALDRAEWHAPAGYDRLYLIREDDHAWTGIDATDDPADVETYRYRESAVAWLRGTEGPDGPIRSADIARWYREHPDEPYYDNGADEMIEKEWTFEDCRVAKYSWGFRVWVSGGHCDVVPGNGDDMDACEAALDNGESPIASGWEDGVGHDVAAECERTCDIETGEHDEKEEE